MMREIDTEQPVVWPEWCYNTRGESRSPASPSSSGDQKGCGLTTMTHNNNVGNGSSGSINSSSPIPPGLSFLTSQMAMSANKLFKLAQQHQQQQQQQNYRPPPMQSPSPSVANGGQGLKRKHLDNAVALLSDRLSPSSPTTPTSHNNNNNNNFSVNNLNLETLSHRLNNGGQSSEEQTSYLLKNLAAAKEVVTSSHSGNCGAIKRERISPISFNNGKVAANGLRSTTTSSSTGRSRSSTPSSASGGAAGVVFNTSSGNGMLNSRDGNNGLLNGLNGTGHSSRNGSSSSLGGELGSSLSRSSLHHHQHQLSAHHQQTFSQQQQQQLLHQSSSEENHLPQSMTRQVEPPQQARNYSDMIRSLAAKYNNLSSENNGGHLISPNTNVTPGGGVQQRERFNTSSSNSSKLAKERESEVVAMRLFTNSNLSASNAKSRSRSPAVVVPQQQPSMNSNKVSMSNPSLAASLATSSVQSLNDHSSATANPTQTSGQSSLISSFLTGLPASMFTPMIDMTSTQALVTLARAAKEAEFLNLLSSTSAATASPSSSSSSTGGCAAVAAAASSPSSTPRPLTNGNATATAAAARKRLQTTRAVFNSTNQKGSVRATTNPAAALLANGGYPRTNLAPPTLPPPPPPATTFPSSLLTAAGTTVTPKGRASSPVLDGCGLGVTMSAVVPLDLSAGPPQSGTTVEAERPMKRIKTEQNLSPSSSPGPDSGIGGGRDPSSSESESPGRRSEGSLSPRQSSMDKWTTGCNHQAEMDEIRSWTVEQVCEFVATIDICAEYSKNFREQSIDGIGLPLLTEEHLRNLLSMKLGPALKLKAILASRMGVQCQKCGGCQATTNPAAATSPAPSETSRRLSQGAATTNSRRSESPSPPQHQQGLIRTESFGSFRAKVAALSPIYNSVGDATAPREGMIATVTMSATGLSTDSTTGSEKDIPMIC